MRSDRSELGLNAEAPAVQATGVVNRFGAQIVHDGLDLTVNRGEIFGIVGGSGSGKSVLLNTILGLRRPQAGEVRIFGIDLNALNTAQLRIAKQLYGVTFQAGALFSSLTVLQNIQLPMLEHLKLSARALEELAMLKLKLESNRFAVTKYFSDDVLVGESDCPE